MLSKEQTLAKEGKEEEEKKPQKYFSVTLKTVLVRQRTKDRALNSLLFVWEITYLNSDMSRLHLTPLTGLLCSVKI